MTLSSTRTSVPEKKEVARSEWGVKDWFLQLQGEDVPSGKM
jgi:hypothetical protein